jgi:TPR repeat protein
MTSFAAAGRKRHLYPKNIRKNAEKHGSPLLRCRIAASQHLGHGSASGPAAQSASGDAQAQLDLGQIYVEGRGVAQSDEKAAHWFGLAAAQGNALSQSNLGLMYDRAVA